jgi:hypothetical protein
MRLLGLFGDSDLADRLLSAEAVGELNLEMETSACLVEYPQLLNLPAVPATQAYS